MKHKIFEIRDSGTMILVLCVDMNPSGTLERDALKRYGFPCDGRPNILMTNLNADGHATNDPYGWHGSSTFQAAHMHIIDNWKTLRTGDVVDVEFIRGVTEAPKKSEVFSHEPLDFFPSSEMMTTVQGIADSIPAEPDKAKIAIISMAIYVAATISTQPDNGKEVVLGFFDWAWTNFHEFWSDHFVVKEAGPGDTEFHDLEGGDAPQ